MLRSKLDRHSFAQLTIAAAAGALLILGTRVSSVHGQGGGCPVGGFALTPTNAAAPAAGASGNVAWTINPVGQCPSNAASLDAFVGLTSAAQFPTGAGNVNYTIASNAGANPRNGRIRITNVVGAYGVGSTTIFTINQASVQGLSVGAASLNFTFTPGVQTLTQSIPVASTAGVLNFTATATQPWLNVTPAAGATPANLTVSVNPSALVPGTYTGSININAPNGTPPSVTIGVTLRVNAAAPSLAVDQASLAFGLTSSSPRDSRRLTIRNAGGGQLPFTATATTQVGSWLSLSANGGTAAGTAISLLASADSAGLAPGTYTGTITIRSAAGDVNINVTMSFASAPVFLVLSPAGLTFRAIAGGPAPPAQSFAVAVQGAGSINYAAATTTVSGGNWLTVAPNGGSATDAAPGTLTVRADPAGLAAGDYYGQVDVVAPGVVNSPQSVLVVLSVAAPTGAPSAAVSPTGLIFVGRPGGAAPASKNVAIANTGLQALQFTATAEFFGGRAWFTLPVGGGVIASGQTTQLEVRPAIAGLAASIYIGEVRIQIVGESSVRRIAGVLVLAPDAVTSVSGLPARSAGACVPTRLQPVFTLLGADFQTAASWPTPIEVQVVDDCGDPMRTGSVVASFSNGDPVIPLLHLRDGRWSGTWPARNTRSAISIEALAQTAAPALTGTATIGGAVQPNPSVPQIAAGGIYNSASFAPNTPLAPGSFITIFGAGLANSATVAESLPLPSSLGGAQGVVGGLRLSLFYASDGQLNAILPFGLAPNVPHQLILRRGSAVSAPETVMIAEAQPGVFTRDQSGGGQGVVVAARADGSTFFPEPGTPASAGNVLVIYCTGLGAVNPPVRAGEAAPFDTLSPTVRNVAVTIGGVAADVAFAGVTPGFAGLYQVNVTVPAGVAPGDDVPVVLTSANQVSRTVTIAVR